MQFHKFIDKLQIKFPLDSALKNDIVGLQLFPVADELEKVLVAYEITDLVVNEAIELEADLIITYHPLIYKPLQIIDYNERVGRITANLIKSKIATYSIHTCFDNFENGSNYILAEMLNLSELEHIEQNPNYPEKGFGIVGKLNKKQDISLFIKHCEQIFLSNLKYNEIGKANDIEKIAIIAGSGMSFYDKVESLEVDAFITSDVKYHDFHKANGNMFIIDPGHFEMEQYILKSLTSNIENIFGDELFNNEIIISCSKIFTNPVRYSSGDFTKEQIKKL